MIMAVSFGADIQRRLKEIRKAEGDVQKVIAEAAQSATFDAIEVAQENTNVGLTGTNTRSGEMKRAWATDSEPYPVNGKTVLANNQQYASYVNDGHRMDKHYVPGLTIDGGMLQRTAEGDDSGIMVGTKTQYVPGQYMKEKAVKAYQKRVRKVLKMRLKELLS